MEKTRAREAGRRSQGHERLNRRQGHERLGEKDKGMRDWAEKTRA